MKKKFLLVTIISIMTTVAFSSCASWERTKKDWESETGNGLERELRVYSSTGEEIYSFTGKFDIDYTEERILFDDEDGKRHTIYFKGGAVVINET